MQKYQLLHLTPPLLLHQAESYWMFQKLFCHVKSNTYHAILFFPSEERDVETSMHFLIYDAKQLW